MELVARIFKIESDLHNDVYFNVSSGGHILSLVGMLSCLLFNGHPYYCEPETYNSISDKIQPFISGVKKIIPLPTFTIEKPSKELITFLIKMERQMNSKGNKDISKKECLEIYYSLNPEKNEKEHKKSGDFNALKFTYLDKLHKIGYIIMENKPRGKVSITHQGYQAINIFWQLL